MVTPHIIGVIFALTSAVVWGTGDFSGGIATRAQNQFQVLFLMTIPGIVGLAIIALLVGEAMPSPRDVLWAFSAGLAGAFGVAALYKGLSLGNAATVAPTAAVIGAGVPVIFSCFFLGVPDLPKILGFIVAIFGIWLVSRPPEGHGQASKQGLILAILAGIGFGGFFTLIAQVDQGLVFIPLVLSKTAAIILALTTLFFRRDQLPSLVSNPIAIFAGFFDAGGNVFFLLAKQFTRLDVAAVLASMYPAVTVILACVILREKVSASQWRGVILCVIAIALIGI
jgi:drug/metabolite transporter (DMT)-like permease